MHYKMKTLKNGSPRLRLFKTIGMLY